MQTYYSPVSPIQNAYPSIAKMKEKKVQYLGAFQKGLETPQKYYRLRDELNEKSIAPVYFLKKTISDTHVHYSLWMRWGNKLTENFVSNFNDKNRLC